MSPSTGENSASGKPVRVLVVDDDSTCLLIVDTMLKKWNYEVVAVKHPIDALCILRMNNGSFDLVVLDVHMPEMNGFELQQLVTQEFNLPVVLMSADKNEAIILKGIESGAVYFISKPVVPDDIRDLWQFAAAKNKNNKFSTKNENDKGKDKGKGKEKEKAIGHDHGKGNSNGNDSSVNIKDLENTKELKGKDLDKATENDKEGDIANCNASRRQKVVWSSELHNRFLEAISKIGLERAVPKKILEEMNVPGLTRENVASHLQKYRIFLKRLADLSSVNCTREKSLSADRFLRSSFMSRNPILTFDKLRQHQMKTYYTGSKGFGQRYSPAATLDSSNNLTKSSPFPILETSAINLLSSRRGQPSLPSTNQDISMQTYKHATVSTPKILYPGVIEPNYNTLTTSGVNNSGSFFGSASRSTPSYDCSNLINPNPISSFNNSNHVGFGNQITGDQLWKMGSINPITSGLTVNMGKTQANTDANNYGNHDKLNNTSILEDVNGNNGLAGEVDFDSIFGNLMNNSAVSTSAILPDQTLQPYDSGNEFTRQVAIQSSNQGQDRDDADFWSSFDSFWNGDMDVPMVQQQQVGADPLVISFNSSSNSGNSGFSQSNAYSPLNFNQNLMTQQQVGADPMLISSNSSSSTGSSSNNGFNQTNAYSPWNFNQNVLSQPELRDDEAFLDSIFSGIGPGSGSSPWDQAN